MIDKVKERQHMQEFMCLPIDMQKDILKEQGIVSTLTHPTKYVAKHLSQYLNRVRGNKPAKRTTSGITRVHAVGNDLRSQAFSLFDQGMTAGAVAKQFMITYGNSHYYYRQWKKRS